MFCSDSFLKTYLQPLYLKIGVFYLHSEVEPHSIVYGYYHNSRDFGYFSDTKYNFMECNLVFAGLSHEALIQLLWIKEDTKSQINTTGLKVKILVLVHV